MTKFFSKYNFLKSSPAIFIYFLFFVLIWTWPIVLSLNSKILGYHDVWQFIWNFWWVKTALINLHTNPFYTNYIHWPNGISLLFHTLNFLNSLAAVPLQYIFKLTTTYNLLIILNFALNGFATYLLAQYLTKNKFAAFIAGYIVAFSPYMFAHALGHLNLMSFGWTVLAILYLIKTFQGKTKWYWASLFIILTGLTEWYYFFYLLIFVVFYLVFLFLTERQLVKERIFWRNFLLIFLLSFLILSPYLGSMIYMKLKTQEFNLINHHPIDYSVDLTALFVPNAPSFYFLKHFYGFWRKWHWTWEGIGYLGYSVLLLAIYAAVKIKKSRKIILFWFMAALLFLLLALGPYLQINGEIYKRIILPYYFLEKLPFMSIQGIPARFMIMVYLSLGVLVAYALTDILNFRTKLKYLIVALLVAVIVLEYRPAKLVISPVEIPQFYETLKNEPGDFAILDLSTEESQVMFYETIHQKRLIGGYTSRPSKTTTEFLDNTPVISNIFHGLDSSELTENPQEDIDILKKYQVKYIIITTQDKKNKTINQNRQSILEKLQLPVVWQRSGIIVYQVY